MNVVDKKTIKTKVDVFSIVQGNVDYINTWIECVCLEHSIETTELNVIIF